MTELHKDIKVKEFVVKENDGYRLKIRKFKCLAPADLNNIDFIQESIRNGKVEMTSTYNFFLTDEEIKKLVGELSQ